MKKISNVVAIFVIGVSAVMIKEGLLHEDSLVLEPNYVLMTGREQKLTADQTETLIRDVEYLKGEFSPHIISLLLEASMVAKSWNNDKEHTLKILGFEDIGLSNQAFHELWSEKFYPKNWIEGNIQTITYSKRSYRDKGYGTEYYYAGRTQDFKHKVDLFGSPNFEPEADRKEWEEGDRQTLDWTFSHELGHENDWVNATYLSPFERVEFLVEVAKAYKNPHSFKSVTKYVESIRNEDRFKQEYYRTREWWGTLCEWYFTFPGLLEERSKKDFLLVDRWVKKRDPQYNPKESQKARNALFKQILKGEIRPLQNKN